MKEQGQGSRVKGQAESITFQTGSPDETEAVGAKLGKFLEAGDIVTLSGELGGGKTCFARGVVSAAAPESVKMVASPTFAILNEYPGSTPIMHYDCYRLRGSDDALELGLMDHLGGPCICLLEWPERIPGVITEDHLEIRFRWLDEEQREITFSSHGDRSRFMLTMLRNNR